MTLNIKKATEITQDNATYLIYANPGVGKTSAIKYFLGKTLVIDIDKSSTVLRGCENIDIAEVNTHDIWDEWTEIVKALLKGAANDYDTIVIDNISELFRSSLANLGRKGNNNRVPSMADYQRVDFTLLDSLRALQKLGKRLVLTAWETSDVWVEPNGQQFNRAMPDVRKSILTNFLGLCDVIGRLVVTEKEDGTQKRGFILTSSPNVFAKNRLDDRKGCKVEDLIVSEGSDVIAD
ncbi:AAA family ATPase [Aerococcaceae bacterium NML130460]|nr:AAA family ATPase [Aerococcaceae bacterium NML130460]